ncbi:MAG: 7-carboxy-7-deazaguanine synthase QueE [Candidatus Zixiibacteriota bacterium]
MSDESITIADTLNIVEVLRTIIGESRYSGYPCTLVRLGGCNLSCKYCDTEYAQKSHAFEEHIFDTAHKIKDEWVLLTGGEPLLQKSAYSLMDILINRNKKIVLETNGSIDISDIPDDVYKIMDLKTPSSGMHKKMNFQNCDYLTENDEVKFLIADDDDFEYALKKIDEHNLLERCCISFSPVYGSIGESELGQAILKTRLPIRLNLQIHKMIGMK